MTMADAGIDAAGTNAAASHEPRNPIEAAVKDDGEQTRKGRYGWLSLVIAGLFGLLYAYDLWQAVSNLVTLPTLVNALGLDSKVTPWWVAIIAIAVPPITFGLAFVLGRRQNLLGKIVIFIVGLSVTSALYLGTLGLTVLLLNQAHAGR
jgi:hypothetical protein